jgi:hypothetical protein
VLARRFVAFSVRCAVVLLLTFELACDKEPSKVVEMAKSASTTAPPPPASETKPASPQKVQLAVDDTAAFVSGERVDLNAPDPKGRFATVVASRKTAGEDLTLEAARDTKLPKLALVVAGVRQAKAKSLVVRTPKRDRSNAEITIALEPKVEGCAAVAWIAKDSSITTQTAGGAGAARFTRGMAGPDLTRGGEGARKLAASCDSTILFASADETVTWGLVVDLILSVTNPEDGGTSKVREAFVLPRPPSLNKKLELE